MRRTWLILILFVASFTLQGCGMFSERRVDVKKDWDTAKNKIQKFESRWLW